MNLTDKDIARFWAKVDIKDDDACWPYLAGRTKFGHGVFSIKHKWVLAHRISFFIENNYLPKKSDNRVVMHDCENPICQNPKHLLDGTTKQNGNYPNCIKKLKSKTSYWLGKTGPRLGAKLSTETKRKISESHIKRRKRMKLVPRHENLLIFRKPQ